MLNYDWNTIWYFNGTALPSKDWSFRIGIGSRNPVPVDRWLWRKLFDLLKQKSTVETWNHGVYQSNIGGFQRSVPSTTSPADFWMSPMTTDSFYDTSLLHSSLFVGIPPNGPKGWKSHKSHVFLRFSFFKRQNLSSIRDFCCFLPFLWEKASSTCSHCGRWPWAAGWVSKWCPGRRWSCHICSYMTCLLVT